MLGLGHGPQLVSLLFLRSFWCLPLVGCCGSLCKLLSCLEEPFIHETLLKVIQPFTNNRS